MATLMAELDLTHLAAAHPLDLSVGERERVALATVLAGGPRVILLDEPSRGMDPARRAMLADALGAVRRPEPPCSSRPTTGHSPPRWPTATSNWSRGACSTEP